MIEEGGSIMRNDMSMQLYVHTVYTAEQEI